MRPPFLGVGEWRQETQPASWPVAAIQRQPEHMVGKVRVLRQKRAMQIGAIGVAVNAALAPVFAIVAVASQHPPERLRAAAEIGTAAVILEADERALAPCQGNVADAAGHLLALV